MQATIAVVGIAGILIYAWQLREMIRATNAATEANKSAREAAHLDQRAWVAPSLIEGKPQEGQPYDIAVTVKNTGKTFALEYKIVVLYKMQELSDPAPDFDAELAAMAEDPIVQLSSGIGLIPPDGTFASIVEASEGRKLTKADMMTVTSPTQVILVFGKIAYKDIFECEHWTKFSARCFPNGKIRNFGHYADADKNRCP